MSGGVRGRGGTGPDRGWDDADLHGLTGAYALDALEADERAAFEEHLDECAACVDEVADLREAAASLGGGLSARPSGDLRARVLAEVARTPQEDADASDAGLRGASGGDGTAAQDSGGEVVALDQKRVPSWVAWTGAVAAGIAAIAVVVLGLELAEANQQLDRTATALAEMEDLLTAPDATTVTVSEGGSEVRLVVSESRGQAMLVAAGMDPAPHEHTYEAWLIDDEGPAPAGLFDADEHGRVAMLMEGDFSGAQAVGVTIEPEGGSPEPTTDPVMVVPLEG